MYWARVDPFSPMFYQFLGMYVFCTKVSTWFFSNLFVVVTYQAVEFKLVYF